MRKLLKFDFFYFFYTLWLVKKRCNGMKSIIMPPSMLLPLLLLTSGVCERVKLISKDAVVYQGDTVTMTCTTNLTTNTVVLSRIIPPATLEEYVYKYNRVLLRRGPRFSVSNEGGRKYILIIDNVTMADAGEYLCTDFYGNGEESHTELSIVEYSPQASICQNFRYRGKAFLSGRWIVNSTQNLTTEIRSITDSSTQHVTSCFHNTSEAKIEFQIYEAGYGRNWTSPKYLINTILTISSSTIADIPGFVAGATVANATVATVANAGIVATVANAGIVATVAGHDTSTETVVEQNPNIAIWIIVGIGLGFLFYLIATMLYYRKRVCKKFYHAEENGTETENIPMKKEVTIL